MAVTVIRYNSIIFVWLIGGSKCLSMCVNDVWVSSDGLLGCMPACPLQ